MIIVCRETPADFLDCGGFRWLDLSGGSVRTAVQTALFRQAAPGGYSTVTDLARLRGWSTLRPLLTARYYASSCNGTDTTIGIRQSVTTGTSIV